uniref:methylcrotonoyl-CoA carboxylase n=1 Tax=Amphimedon queenslandica TaxID=400682 RepID=A0A1X7VUJ9_AMPQE
MMLLRRPISHLSSLSRISHSMKLHDSKDTRSNNCSFPHIPSAYSINNINEDNNDSFEINMNCYKKMETIRQNVLSAKAPEGSKKLSVFDRIKLLSDDGSPLLYLSTTAGLNLPYGSIRNAGTITAITRIMGKYCIISGNDWIFKGGTAFPISVKKQLRVHEIAMENRLPCIYLVDSGGAFLPLQADIYADKEHGGRSFRNEAVLSSMGIPQIAVVCGPCTAGGAYIPTMCDEAVIVKGSGSLYLGGPPLVKAATGESINSEELEVCFAYPKVTRSRSNPVIRM